MASRAALLLVASASFGSFSCGGDGSDSPRTQAQSSSSSESEAAQLYALRNQAKLHADRFSEEGYVEGARLLADVTARPGQTWVDQLNRARCLVFTPDFTAASAILDEAERLRERTDPDPSLEYVRGLHAKKSDDFATALAHFSKVTDLRPELLQAWYQRGFCEERMKQWEEADQSYIRVLQVDPEFRGAAYRRVIVLRNLQRKDEEKAAAARFQAIPDEPQPDPEKCWLTQVTLIPASRSEAEPPAVDLAWKDVTPAWREEAGSWSEEAARWREEAAPSHEGVSVLLADFDNDGSADRVLLRVLPAGGSTSSVPQVQWSGGDVYELPGDLAPDAAVPIDLDHDGDLDLVGMFEEGPTADPDRPYVYSWIRNNGDRTFTRMGRLSDLAAKSRASLRASWDVEDLDRGNDIDIVLAGGNVPKVLLNLRDGSFRAVAVPEMGPQDCIRSGDFDNDGAPDLLAVRNADGVASWTVSLSADPLGSPGKVRWRVPVRGSLDATVEDIAIEDFDNDADLDAILATSKGVVWLRNSGGVFSVAGNWMPNSESEGSESRGNAAITSVAARDLDGDGQVEVMAVTADRVYILAPSTPTPYASWSVQPEGKRDNLDAIGTVVTQFAGLTYQRRMIRGADGVRFGLGQASVGEVDGIRLLWPQGIVQPEDRNALVFATSSPAGVPRVEVTQMEGLVASCPFLYTKGSGGWQFLTDVVGIAPLDEWLPAGQQPHLDPEEFVRIEGAHLDDSSGQVHLKITEELRETTYLDRLELISVQHDEDVTLWIDESTNQGAYDSLRVFAFRNDEVMPPVRARRGDGTDVTDRLATANRQYVHGYQPAPSQWSGWVAPYDLELAAPAGTASILLTGRIGWYDSTVSYALHQHGRAWGPFQLTSMEGESVLTSDIGLPAGMDRTMVSRFREPLTAETKLVLSAHHRFLWDRILFAPEPFVVDPHQPRGEQNASGGELWDDASGQAAFVQAEVLSLRQANLSFYGYSRMVGDRALHEQTYRYGETEVGIGYAPAAGKATRYGDVQTLLGSHDDELVVLVAGDGLDLAFDAPEPLPEGRTRTYFLRVTGWAKEGSFHNLTGREIAPLPLRGMTRYPPTFREQRTDTAYLDYLKLYQTRDTAPLHSSSVLD